MTDRAPRIGSAMLLALLTTTPAQSAEYHVDTSASRDVAFTSEVVGFSFEGHNELVDGYLYWKGPGLFEGEPQLLFRVEVNGFDTGIGKRDHDLRDVLDTGRHPFTSYTAKIVSHTPILDSLGSATGSHRVETRGTLSLHGVEREVTIPGTIAFTESGAAVDADFDLRLADYGIEAPSLAAFVKVSERIDIHVALPLKRIEPKEADR